jgi:hypothetical protein
MKKISIIFSFCFFVMATIGVAQDQPVDSTHISRIDSTQPTIVDSAQLLKYQERQGKISGQLARNREKLSQLEKEYQEKTVDKQKAIEQAEASAVENRRAAEELSNDASNRSKARRAEKLASRARRDTKSVQRADKNLERLEKNIHKVKKMIDDDQKALMELQQGK